MKKRVISILLSAAMISSMVVAGGVTAHAEENVTLNVFDAHAYGLEEYDEMVKAFEAVSYTHLTLPTTPYV